MKTIFLNPSSFGSPNFHYHGKMPNQVPGSTLAHRGQTRLQRVTEVTACCFRLVLRTLHGFSWFSPFPLGLVEKQANFQQGSAITWNCCVVWGAADRVVLQDTGSSFSLRTPEALTRSWSLLEKNFPGNPMLQLRITCSILEARRCGKGSTFTTHLWMRNLPKIREVKKERMVLGTRASWIDLSYYPVTPEAD